MSIRGKQPLAGGVWERRRTRNHARKLNEMWPWGNWLEENGLQFQPRRKAPSKPSRSPAYPPGMMFGEEEDDSISVLSLGEAQLSGPIMPTHVEHEFRGKIMLWLREEWDGEGRRLVEEAREAEAKKRKRRLSRGAAGKRWRRTMWKRIGRLRGEDGKFV